MFSSPLTAGVQPQALPQPQLAAQPQAALGFAQQPLVGAAGGDTASKLATIAAMTGTVTQLVGQLGGLMQGGAGANLMGGGPMIGGAQQFGMPGMPQMGMPGALPMGAPQAAAGCGCAGGMQGGLPMGMPGLSDADAMAPLSAPGGGGDAELLSAISDAGAAEEADLSDADAAEDVETVEDSEGTDTELSSDSAEASEDTESAAGADSESELSDGDSEGDSESSSSSSSSSEPSTDDLNPAGTQSGSTSDSSSTTTGGGDDDATVAAPQSTTATEDTAPKLSDLTYQEYPVSKAGGETLEDIVKKVAAFTDLTEENAFKLIQASESNQADTDFDGKLGGKQLEELSYETDVKGKDILLDTGATIEVPVKKAAMTGTTETTPVVTTETPIVDETPQPAAGPTPRAGSQVWTGDQAAQPGWYTMEDGNTVLFYTGNPQIDDDGFLNHTQYDSNYLAQQAANVAGIERAPIPG